MKTVQTIREDEKSVAPIAKEPEVKFYSWFLTTNYLHLIVYAIAVKRGDDFLYMEDHMMIRRCAKDNQNDANDNNTI